MATTGKEARATTAVHTLTRVPAWEALEDSQHVVLAGCGGGFDVFAALPLYSALRESGRRVTLANLTFTSLELIPGDLEWIVEDVLLRVTADTDTSTTSYFPEAYLARFLRDSHGEEDPCIFTFARTGVAPVKAAYRALIEHLGDVDAVVLVDGGTDSLMAGNESGLGTPTEDATSMLAVDALEDLVPLQLLWCIGFGIDTYHGVAHADFLEATGDLTAQGAFYGSFSLLPTMTEFELYRDACLSVFDAMPHNPSIVNASIINATEGRFGDDHTHIENRTRGSELFINHLMTLYFVYDLHAVVKRMLYKDAIAETQTWAGTRSAISHWRQANADTIKPRVSLPM